MNQRATLLPSLAMIESPLAAIDTSEHGSDLGGNANAAYDCRG